LAGAHFVKVFSGDKRLAGLESFGPQHLSVGGVSGVGSLLDLYGKQVAFFKVVWWLERWGDKFRPNHLSRTGYWWLFQGR
ncbi:hypothetical protein, partial [Gilvimarinus sp. 1_MG-2023]|uniref:hypothetical protein n=1 Tax=Gilvimarinus sp. 1_MG-2023 TaxID=3062638 RepID=UPI0026E28CAF